MAEKALDSPSGSAATERRLFDGSVRLGREIGRTLGVSTPQEVMAAARILYRCLEIDFRGDAGGDIIIRQCFFSRFYSSEVCRLMSSLDAGILSGLAGGGGLEFAERLTEGRDRCLARFSFKDGA